MFSQLAELINGEVMCFSHDRPITTLLLDSRKSVAAEGAVFFAIKGERHDGHAYLEQLYLLGIRQFVVEAIPADLSLYPDSNIVKVENSVVVLQTLARFHRTHFSLPVIGITGSNGKTILKEWLFQLLSRTHVIVKNPGSYNSQIGVPLSVWQMRDYHTLGIFEAGISRRGEMAKLREIIRPDLGVFTNIGSAHDEGFSNHHEKINEKLELFSECKTIVYCKDHTLIHKAILYRNLPSLTWGSQGADIIIRYENGIIHGEYKANPFSFNLPFRDSASVENCSHLIAVLLHLGYDQEFIQKGISLLKVVPMRLELKEGINQCQVVDDTYNNDLAGIEISLQFLMNQQQKKKKTVILSDVLETGLSEVEQVRNISSLINKHAIDRFIGIGRALKKHGKNFVPAGLFYESTMEFLKRHPLSEFQNEIILVKGARVFGFEEITKRLQRKIHGTIMEINLDALVHNFNLVKSRLDKRVKVMVMVKAFAYGSGSNEIANLLQYHQADYLGVAYPDEGVELRKNNITLPIMVMNSSEENYDQLITYNLEPEIYSFSQLDSFIGFLGARECRIHLKLDTGMKRLGFEEDQIPAVIQKLKTHRNLTVASVFSHLAAADEEAHDAFSHQQAARFRAHADAIAASIGYRPLYHLLNSSGILRFPEYQFDMVRLGIGLYGVDPTGKDSFGLKPVATLKTIISQIKNAQKNETVGYGRRGKAREEMQIATIAIGYADGFSRAFSRGVGKVLVHGKEARVIGNVCMDMTMVDITGIPAKEGDEVIVFGDNHPIQEIASLINTIPYEILTNTSERVKRVFTTESL